MAGAGDVPRVISARPRDLTHFLAWCGAAWLPRAAASRILARRPAVERFGADTGLAREVAGVNVVAPTTFCVAMTWEGSDKGRAWHNYTPVYARLLARRRREALRIFELGLGTNNPALQSSMGATGRPGASLRGWARLFPRAAVFGADIDRSILFQNERIRTFYCDQLDAGAIAALWAEPALAEGMDLIIEDGLHTLEASRNFLDGSLRMLRTGGLYVAEDIATETLPAWRRLLAEVYAPGFPACAFVLARVPNRRNRVDNNLLVVRKEGLLF